MWGLTVRIEKNCQKGRIILTIFFENTQKRLLKILNTLGGKTQN